MMPHTLNTLIVDDNAVCRKVMTSIIDNLPDTTVVETASDGKVALAKLRYLAIDLVLMDIDMPRMDGLEALSRIKSRHPDVDVLMISSSYQGNAEKVVRALQLGAIDFLPKLVVEDENSIRNFRLNLLPLLGLIKSRRQFKTPQPLPEQTVSAASEKRPERPEYKKSTIPLRLLPRIEVVAIASSTGGPNSLMTLIPNLPEKLGVPILIVQHMPKEMTGYLAANLNEKSRMNVCEAAHGDIILPDVVYIAPGGKHMMVKSEKRGNTEEPVKFIALNEDPPENSVRPAADVLFRSIASAYSGNILAIIMTGMGSDGLKGVQAMKQNMCYCLSQSADTCVVYGMPKAVDDAGISDEQVPLDRLAGRIEEIVLKTG